MNDDRRRESRRNGFKCGAFALGAIFLNVSGMGEGFDPLRTETPACIGGAGDSQLLHHDSSEADSAGPLSLSRAVDLALSNNQKLKQAWANIRRSAAAVGEARSAYLPTITGEIGRIGDTIWYEEGEIAPTKITDNTANAAMSWRLLDFGVRSSNGKAANHLLMAALASRSALIQQTLVEVIRDYFDTYTARDLLNSRRQMNDLYKKTLDATKSREANGVSDETDVLEATTALAKGELEENKASGDYQKATAMLVFELGVPSDTPIQLPDALDDKEAESAGVDANNLMYETGQNHPAIAAARAQLDAAKDKLRAAQAGAFPTIDFSANFFQNGRPGQSLEPIGTREKTAGIMISIPFFDGFATVYKVREARADVENSRAVLADTENETLMEVAKARADVSSALQNLHASASLADTAQMSFSMLQRKFDNGSQDILKLLNAEAILADAKDEHVHWLAEWRSARLRLLGSLGRLNRLAVANKK